MDNFNFRDLGARDSRKLAATRLKHHTMSLQYFYDDKMVQKCNKVLQSCIDFSNGKITRTQLSIICRKFKEEIFLKGDIKKSKRKNINNLATTRIYLLFRAIEECSCPTFYPRITFNLINGYAALQGWYTSEKERTAQTSAYNRYMRAKQRTTQEIIRVQQPNVLYPNRLISFPNEDEEKSNF